MRRALDSWLYESPPRLYDHSERGWVCVPLPVRPGADKERVIADAVQRLDELARAFRDAGLHASAQVTEPAESEALD